MRYLFYFIIYFFISTSVFANGYDVYGIGYYDVKFDGSTSNDATDFRYERRFDHILFDIGPEEDNFFYLKPFVGFELTSESASYFLTGIYLEDNLGQIVKGKENKFILTPSFGAGYYNEGGGKKLGHKIEFRTTIEISYQLKNNHRLAASFGHISNANLGSKNPGVEVFGLSYQVPY